VLYFLAFVGFGVWPLVAVFLVPLWWALERLGLRPARCALAGLVFGAVAYAGGHLWLWRLVAIFLDGDAGLGAALLAAHGLWFSAGYALYGLAYAAVRRRGWPVAVAGVAPLLVLEWLKPQIFPVHAGSALVGVTPLVQIADLGGPLLLTAFATSLDVVVYETLAWLAGRRRRPLATWTAVATATLAVLAYGGVRTAQLERALEVAPSLRVGIVQANLGLIEKRTLNRVAHERHVALTRQLLAEGPLDLVVWPETAELTAIRGPLPVSGRFVREDLDVPLLFGGTLVHEQDGRRAKSNSAFLVRDDGLITDVYRKNLLIPLAEWVPFGRLFPWLAERLPHAQDFAASRETPALALGPWRISTPICYEAVRADLVRRMVATARPELLVSLANDAWFGDSQEPWMHLQLSRLRAVEERRFLVRATNSGISALVDPLGRITARTGLLTEATLRGSVRLLEGRTLYARSGDWPGGVATAVLLAALVVRRKEGAAMAPPG